jgi:hypothetical protein
MLPIQLNFGASNWAASGWPMSGSNTIPRAKVAITVPSRGIEEKVDGLEAAGPDRVLDDDTRVSGNMPAKEPAQLAGIDVVAAAGAEAHQHPHGLARVEGRILGRKGRSRRRSCRGEDERRSPLRDGTEKPHQG